MNFTKTDITIILAMSISIVALSFAMPALGLTGDTVENDNMPRFNMSASSFDFAAQFPDNPGTPAKGYMDYDVNNTGASNNQVWLEGDTSNGVEILMSDTTSNDAQIMVYNWDGGTTQNSSLYTLSGKGESVTHDDYGYEIYFEMTDYEENNGYINYDITYELKSQPSDQSWLDRIPVVGSVYSGAEALAQIVSWIGSVLWFFVTTLFQITLNLLSIMYQVLSFVFGTLSWLFSVYTGIITGAEAWASVFVLLPGILLSLEMVKLTFIAISLLPTT